MNRKELVKRISEHFNVKSRYLGAPTLAYELDIGPKSYTIDREGKIMDEQGRVIELKELLATTENSIEESNVKVSYEITLPLKGHTGGSVKNMLNMIYSKQPLIKKSLNIEDSIVEEDFSNLINGSKVETLEDLKTALEGISKRSHPNIDFDFIGKTITFRFINESKGEIIKAATDLIGLISVSAKTQKYASVKIKPTTNEKYTFRTWLLRLGMVGDQYKDSRRELLKNLTGKAAFKGGKSNEA